MEYNSFCFKSVRAGIATKVMASFAGMQKYTKISTKNTVHESHGDMQLQVADSCCLCFFYEAHI